ncbi:MAG: hypothetical protein KDC18_14280 [Alphaproteobacteria bacterium]|nr:hypothetical protein [Alphaproteobacteria bacterium]MCB9928622.1 hypothetical protein [Alphaproteobacteria bacterium]
MRSFVDWQRAAAEAGLAVLDLVRTDSAAVLRSPENDVLVLGRSEAA